MNQPRDEFERELYGEQSFSVTRLDVFWQLLALAGVAYLIAGALALFSQRAELSAAEFESVVLVGGVLITVASGLLAAWVLLLTQRSLERACHRWQCG